MIRNRTEREPRVSSHDDARADVLEEFADEGRPLERGLSDGAVSGNLVVPRVRLVERGPIVRGASVRRRVVAPGEHMLVGTFAGMASSPEEPPFRAPSVGFFRRFLSLWRRSDDALCAYAGTFGLLGICAGCGRRFGTKHAVWCPGARWSPGWIAGATSEPASGWRRYSRAADAVVAVAAKVVREETVDPRLERGVRWLANNLAVEMRDELHLSLILHRGNTRGLVAFAVNAWLRASPFTLAIEDDAFGPGFVPRLARGPSRDALWSALGEQLAKVVSRAENLYGCAECGAWFFPVEQPRRDAPPLCDAHANDSTRAKHRMRRLRARKHVEP